MTSSTVFEGSSVSASDIQRRVRRLRQIATLLDSAFTLPVVGRRIGLDSLIGLLPGIGDTAMTAIGGFIVLEGWRLGMPARLLGRMAANLAIDWGVGSIPLAGDVFDLFYKANLRNVAIIEQWAATRRHTPR